MKRTSQVKDRIVYIHHPHVHPNVRSKVKTESEAKIYISLLDGFARVNHFNWDVFSECQVYQKQANAS